MAAARHTLANCARCDGGAQVASEGASKKVTRERFDQHAWPRLRALKAHAETPKNVEKTTLVGPRFGVQTSDPKTGAANTFLLKRAPTLGAKFWTPKWGPAGVMFFEACALSKNDSCEQVRRVHRRVWLCL